MEERTNEAYFAFFWLWQLSLERVLVKEMRRRALFRMTLEVLIKRLCYEIFR